jgi:hypothetical protein
MWRINESRGMKGPICRLCLMAARLRAASGPPFVPYIRRLCAGCPPSVRQIRQFRQFRQFRRTQKLDPNFPDVSASSYDSILTYTRKSLILLRLLPYIIRLGRR